jgi:hypothetical protein
MRAGGARTCPSCAVARSWRGLTGTCATVARPCSLYPAPCRRRSRILCDEAHNAHGPGPLRRPALSRRNRAARLGVRLRSHRRHRRHRTHRHRRLRTHPASAHLSEDLSTWNLAVSAGPAARPHRGPQEPADQARLHYFLVDLPLFSLSNLSWPAQIVEGPVRVRTYTGARCAPQFRLQEGSVLEGD